MSVSVMVELQKLIYDTLKTSTSVMSEASDVYDNIPPKPWGQRNGYISFGPCDVIEDDANCIIGAAHSIQIDCWSRQVGDLHAKRMVDAVKIALHGRDLLLTENALVELHVTMRRVFRDPDGLTSHGIVIVEAMVEESE